MERRRRRTRLGPKWNMRGRRTTARARTPCTGPGPRTRQTVAAAGTTLREHHNSREATLQGRGGRHPADAEAITGDLLTVSIAPHTLRAVEDSALLLSVSLGLGAPDSVAPACARRADQPVPQAALRQGYTRAFDGRIRHPSRTTMAMSLSRARRTRSRSWRSRPP
jgi:hypothetical protein